ncbi:MAG: hypothetical protein M3545_19930 [Acidobacteriota bacterium]|nr:hypothetical protein [Acidobacteriota bacterium]
MIAGARRRGISLTFAAALLGCAAIAAGQDVPLEDQPIGRFVLDARAAFPKFKQDPNIARGIGVTALNLPTRALGFVLGAHWYPARMGPVTLGLGGELIMAGRNRTLPAADADGVAGPTVHSEISSMTPQVSFNFGRRQGWSYISGGIGSTAFTAERQDAPLPPQEARTRTYNYGGGARWFANKRVAVAVDLRFYAISAQAQTLARPAFSRMTLVVVSAGAAFK